MIRQNNKRQQKFESVKFFLKKLMKTGGNNAKNKYLIYKMQRKLHWIALNIKRLTTFFQDYDSWWPNKVESDTPKKNIIFMKPFFFKTGGDNNRRFHIKNKVIFLHLFLPRTPIGHAICKTKLRDYNLTKNKGRNQNFTNKFTQTVLKSKNLLSNEIIMFV